MATPLAHVELTSPRFARIGAWRVDFASNEVSNGAGTPQRLSPKAAGVLRVLLTHGDVPVHRERLIELVWPGQFRTDDVITKAMHELRKLFADGSGIAVIENLPRVGYRIKCAWQWEQEERRLFTTEALLSATTDVSASPSVGSEIAAGTSRPPSRVRSFWLLTTLVVATASVVVLQRFLRVDVKAPMAKTLALVSADQPFAVHALSGDAADEVTPAMSPDGEWVVVAERSVAQDSARLVLRSIDGTVARELASENEFGAPMMPRFAPDGRAIAFQRGSERSCRIELLSLLGGTPRVLSDCVPGLMSSIEFFPDGRSLLLPRVGAAGPNGIRTFEKVDIDSGQRSNYAYGAEPRSFDLEGRFSPDGRQLLIRRDAAPWGRLMIVDTQTHAARSLGNFFGAIHGIAWLQDNRHVLVASDATGPMTLWRLDTTTGKRERLSGLRGQFPDAARHADIVVFQHTREPQRIERFSLTEKRSERVFASTGSEWEPSLLPDGRHLAFVSDRTGTAQIYFGDLSDGSVKQMSSLTDGAPYDLSFSRDGRQVAFSLRGTELLSSHLLDLSSGGLSELELVSGGVADFRLGWRPGEWLSVRYDAEQKPWVYRARVSAGAATPLEAQRISTCTGRMPMALDGDWIYFMSGNFRTLLRVPADAHDAPCERVSDQVRWWNRATWAKQRETLFAFLRAEPEDSRPNGIYALLEPAEPRLLYSFDELGRFVPSGARFAYTSDAVYATVVAHSDADIMVLEPSR